jgi:hypothetical protein
MPGARRVGSLVVAHARKAAPVRGPFFLEAGPKTERTHPAHPTIPHVAMIGTVRTLQLSCVASLDLHPSRTQFYR